MNIPPGYCQCGCGQKTKVASRTRASEGIRKGVPKRYVLGHNARTSPDEYAVDPETGCWLWQRSIVRGGYGIAWRDGKHAIAHRWYYEHLVGPIPEDLALDHLCRVRHCVNPAHLEPVTHRENCRRGANAILTDEKVVRLRADFASAGLPKRTFARERATLYGVSHHCIRDILRGKTWQEPSTSPPPQR
jgi:hypothetical protein